MVLSPLQGVWGQKMMGLSDIVWGGFAIHPIRADYKSALTGR